MPVEIRELVIRAVVEPAGRDHAEPMPAGLDDEARAQLVQDCVAEVMRLLRRAQEP